MLVADMKTQDKRTLRKIIDYLTESHLECQGGYPFDWAIVGEKLIIAEIDGNDESHLAQYDIGGLLAIYGPEEWESEVTEAKVKNETF